MMKNNGWFVGVQLLVWMIIGTSSQAKEGMWIPGMLGAAFDDMQAMGLKLSEDELYSVNTSSMKDGIALFGGGCTAEMVSDRGLLFTNRHCGLSFVQSHSSVEHDYITHGFWAMNAQEELPCPGLTVSYILRMDDVTSSVNEGITAGMASADADKIRIANRKKIEDSYRSRFSADASVKAFNYGNQFIVVVSRTYNDVRLVGAPPAAIGKFGGDTDNWVWPRHTGDFSVFRVYAGENNQPAAYSTSNKPYKPGHFFPVSLDGVEEGDFTMVYGFPGRTDHLLTSYAVDYVVNKSNPMRIEMRTASLDALDIRMSSSDKVRIQYTSKQSDIANAWKKWMGQQMGLDRFHALQGKVEQEKKVAAYIAGKGNKEWATILPSIEKLYAEYGDYLLARDGFIEYFFYGPELFEFAQRFTEYGDNAEKWQTEGTLEEKKKALRKSARNFYKDFDLTTEKDLFNALTPLYAQYVRPGMGPEIIGQWMAKRSKSPGPDPSYIYDRSLFSDSTKFLTWLAASPGKQMASLKKDPVYLIGKSMMDKWQGTLNPKFQEFNRAQEELMASYVRVWAAVFPDAPQWSDANSTLRISYGKVEGSKPRDGMAYLWNSTSEGVMEKWVPNNPDFELPQRLIDLFGQKQFGVYGSNGVLPIAFTGSNHTTGGNSGSPALNDRGHLIGINFDRSWESTMSDILYSPEICRNIMVDIRYVLWVIDVYANADYLLNEMKLIRTGSEKAEMD